MLIFDTSPSLSVAWEPTGDGKKVISLADNHILLWDLQESSSQAVVSNENYTVIVFCTFSVVPFGCIPNTLLDLYMFRILTLVMKWVIKMAIDWPGDHSANLPFTHVCTGLRVSVVRRISCSCTLCDPREAISVFRQAAPEPPSGFS